MKRLLTILIPITFLFSHGLADVNPYVQKGELQRRESTGDFGKEHDHKYKGAKYTFIDLEKTRVTVIIDLKDDEPARRNYTKTSNTGKVITLRREGVARYTDTIFVNIEKMEFRHLQAAYAFDKDFDCSVGYGKLTSQ